MDGNFILSLLGLVCVIVGGAWVYEQSIQRRFKTMWERKDEQDKENLATYVKKEIYDNDQKHLKERSDDRFNNIMQSVDSKYEALTKRIEELKEAIKENKKEQL